ncbi:MAG: sigma-70 family RNA polymerase sigma factor [Microscillaceae bacterium]
MAKLDPALLQKLIQGCRQGDRQSQKLLYQQFFSLAMSITLRYAASHEEAQEMLNDGFLKVFTKLDKYDSEKPFELWLRRIFINTAIDYFRRHQRQTPLSSLGTSLPPAVEASVWGEMNEKVLLDLVQGLPPAYRMVFNLFVMEGFKHEEIASQLGIQVGTSKSNLAKARKLLQKRLQLIEKIS